MPTYFADFDIYNSEGIVVKWANSTTTSTQPSDKVFEDIRKSVAAGAGVPVDQVRARYFGRV